MFLGLINNVIEMKSQIKMFDVLTNFHVIQKIINILQKIWLDPFYVYL